MTTTMHAAYQADHGFDASFREALDRRAYAVLATTGPDGAAHTVPVMFAFDGERFLFESNHATRKVRNIEATGRARILVEFPGHGGWVAAAGQAEIVRGEDARRLNRQVAGRYVTEEGGRLWERAFGELDDVTIVLTPDAWSSWRMDSIGPALVEVGYDPERPDDFFLPLDD